MHFRLTVMAVSSCYRPQLKSDFTSQWHSNLIKIKSIFYVYRLAFQKSIPLANCTKLSVNMHNNTSNHYAKFTLMEHMAFLHDLLPRVDELMVAK